MGVNKRTARTAGYLYLVIIFGSVIGGMLTGMWLEAQKAGEAMLLSEWIYRAGFSVYLLVYLVEVAAAVVLYALLKPVDRNLALLAAFLRLAEAVILGLNMLNQYNVFLLYSNSGLAGVLPPEQARGLVSFYLEAHRSGYLLSQLFFGLHCFFLGYLIYRSGYFPRLIGAFLMLACFGYLSESFAYFLLPNYTALDGIFGLVSALPAVLAEFALTYWLLFRGRAIENGYRELAGAS